MTWSSRNCGFSHVVEFTVDPIHMRELVASLMSRIERFTCSCPGFIRACVQVSDEGDFAGGYSCTSPNAAMPFISLSS